MKTLEKNSKKKKKNIFKKQWNGVPATVRPTLHESSLFEAVFASLFWHIVGGLLIWLIVFLFMFFGITPKLFPVPKEKIQDLEFIIKSSSSHRSHYNRVETVQSNLSPDVAPVNPEPQTTPISQSTASSKNSTTSKAKSSTHSNVGIPDFSVPMANLKSMSSGLGGSGKTTHRVAGFDSSSAAGFGSSSSSGGSSSASSGFDKNTTRKMISTYDISPYVNELKRNIRWNWKTPKDNGGKRVELFLRIAKDGKVVILNVKKTSEIGDVDNAALNAVRKSMPLSPLPAKYTKSYLDVIFTFDSNSVGSRY